MTANSTARLEVLDYEQCTQLLASAVIGRLAWVGSTGAMLVPVNFEWTGTTIRIRTDPGARLQEIVSRPVAFEIDELDTLRRTGWSVVVTGPAHLQEVGTEPPRSWAPGRKSLCVELVPHNIAGRRLVADPSPTVSLIGGPTPESTGEQPHPEPADLNPFWRLSAYS